MRSPIVRRFVDYPPLAGPSDDITNAADTSTAGEITIVIGYGAEYKLPKGL